MAHLRLLVGLGNPGPEYYATRHNVGFMVLDRLAQQQGLGFSAASKWDCLWTRWNEVILMKPRTYMNRRGDSVAGVPRYFRIKPSGLLVVVDHVSVRLGRLR